jgi:hypothetical protein
MSMSEDELVVFVLCEEADGLLYLKKELIMRQVKSTIYATLRSQGKFDKHRTSQEH